MNIYDPADINLFWNGRDVSIHAGSIDALVGAVDDVLECKDEVNNVFIGTTFLDLEVFTTEVFECLQDFSNMCDQAVTETRRYRIDVGVILDYIQIATTSPGDERLAIHPLFNLTLPDYSVERDRHKIIRESAEQLMTRSEGIRRRLNRVIEEYQRKKLMYRYLLFAILGVILGYTGWAFARGKRPIIQIASLATAIPFKILMDEIEKYYGNGVELARRRKALINVIYVVAWRIGRCINGLEDHLKSEVPLQDIGEIVDNLQTWKVKLKKYDDLMQECLTVVQERRKVVFKSLTKHPTARSHIINPEAFLP